MKTQVKIITIASAQIIIALFSIALLPLWFTVDIITVLESKLEHAYQYLSTTKRIIASRQKINRRFNML